MKLGQKTIQRENLLLEPQILHMRRNQVLNDHTITFHTRFPEYLRICVLHNIYIRSNHYKAIQIATGSPSSNHLN